MLSMLLGLISMPAVEEKVRTKKTQWWTNSLRRASGWVKPLGHEIDMHIIACLLQPVRNNQRRGRTSGILRTCLYQREGYQERHEIEIGIGTQRERDKKAPLCIVAGL